MNRYIKFLLLAVLVLCTGSLFAQVVAPVVAPVTASPVVVAPVAPSVVSQIFGALTSSGFLSGLLALGAAVVAVIKNSQLKTSQKVAIVAVKTVEYATSIPEVQKFAQQIKQQATTEASNLGVQDDLHQIVKNVTPAS